MQARGSERVTVLCLTVHLGGLHLENAVRGPYREKGASVIITPQETLTPQDNKHGPKRHSGASARLQRQRQEKQGISAKQTYGPQSSTNRGHSKSNRGIGKKNECLKRHSGASAIKIGATAMQAWASARKQGPRQIGASSRQIRTPAI